MLQGGGIGVPEIVEWGVVMNDVADVGEVQALISGGFEDGEIGIVGNLFVGGVENGAGDGMRGVLREETHGPIVGVTGFEHEAGTRGAAAVHVDDGANFLGPGMLIDENASAEQAGFFAVVNEENDGVTRLRERSADVRNFEDGGGAGAIVERAGAGGDGIVMRGEENCGPCRLRAFEARQDILDRAAVALFVAGEASLYRGQVTGIGKFVEDAAADYVVLRAAGGMGNAIADETIQDFAGTRG